MGVTSNDLLSSGSNPTSKHFHQTQFSSSRRLFYCFEEGGRISPQSRVKFDIAFRAFFKKPVHKYFITRLQVVFAQMPSREDTVNIVLQVNMVSIFSVFNAKHFPFDCDFLTDERLAYARNVKRIKLSSGLPVVHPPALAASAHQTSED